MQAARLPIKRASRPHSNIAARTSILLYLKLHPSILRFALFGGVVGDGLVGAVAFGNDVGSGAAEGDKVIFDSVGAALREGAVGVGRT